MTEQEIQNAVNDADLLLSSLEVGDAIYIHGDGRVELGRDGCQPSNTLCLTVYGGEYDGDYLTLDEIEQRIRKWQQTI